MKNDCGWEAGRNKGNTPAHHTKLSKEAVFSPVLIISVSFCPQVSALPGSVFNMAPSHMFGNRLNPNSAMAALIAQSEASPAGLELTHVTQSCVRRVRGGGDNGLSPPPSRGPIRYDSSGSLPGPGGETLPPVATTIEQLLERQWNEGQNFLLQQGAQGDGERQHAISADILWGKERGRP
uniref:Uncharacterized protein n=1 Tax=Hippocampus comes TaxID=109280 RepID=A0A3Q3D6J5_HIPCM